MPDQPEVIREQIRTTQSALAEKLGVLEDRVANTVTEAKSAVADTVATVKSNVRETVETIRATLDIEEHVRNHPWVFFGGAVALGWLAAQWLSGETPFNTTKDGRPGLTSWLGDLAKAYTAEFRTLLAGAAFESVRETLAKAAPENMREDVAKIIDEIGERLGTHGGCARTAEARS